MFNLYAEHFSEAHRQELLKEAEQHHLVAQALEERRKLPGIQRPSLYLIARNWIYAIMDWSGSRLVRLGNALRKPYEEFCLQDQVQAAELCQES